MTIIDIIMIITISIIIIIIIIIICSYFDIIILLTSFVVFLLFSRRAMSGSSAEAGVEASCMGAAPSARSPPGSRARSEATGTSRERAAGAHRTFTP